MDIVKEYISLGYALPNFSKLLSGGMVRTSAETEVELLEPWIQWASVHTGKSFDEHKIFRLGDITQNKQRQVFEEIESRGYKVGCLSPMNSRNELENPAFFIPDPWTLTHSDNSFASRLLASAMKQLVNDNAQAKLTFGSVWKLCLALLLIVPIRDLLTLSRTLKSSVTQPWRKAIFFDTLLHVVFENLVKRTQPDFAVLFLNAGAHIQHHYMHSSKVLSNLTGCRNPEWYVPKGFDPLAELLMAYDGIVGQLTNRVDYEYVIATGLTQKIYSEPEFYYRLKDHAEFLNLLDITYSSVTPRMSRDFLVSFIDNQDRNRAAKQLLQVTIDGIAIFQNIEIRDFQIFATLEHPKEILPTAEVLTGSGCRYFALNHLVIVAIKNGGHDSEGFLFKSDSLPNYGYLSDKDHVKNIFYYLQDLFPSATSAQ
ncbi:hypothetical protein OAC78_04960 [Litorivicinus sp.]|nr:hypothetical protein [Litorivicinus sp.]